MSEESEIIDDREVIDKICKSLKNMGIDADIREIHDDESCSTANVSCYGKNNNLLFYMSRKLYDEVFKR